MSEDVQQTPVHQTKEKDGKESLEKKQEFDLYIKASTIDKEGRGSCPICQQWFMIAYLLAENQDGVNFKVFTVQADCPPKNFVDEGWSKKFPVVIARNCVDKAGFDLSGKMYDTFEDLEKFFESINKSCPELKRHNLANSEAMKEIENLYPAFMNFLKGKPKTQLDKAFKNLNSYLESQEGKFLLDDVLCFADCCLLPRLQHIVVASKRDVSYEIPKECKAIWRYLREAYRCTAFEATLPSDQDIACHYEKKTTFKHPRSSKAMLEKFTYTKSLLPEIERELESEECHDHQNENNSFSQYEETGNGTVEAVAEQTHELSVEDHGFEQKVEEHQIEEHEEPGNGTVEAVAEQTHELSVGDDGYEQEEEGHQKEEHGEENLPANGDAIVHKDD